MAPFFELNLCFDRHANKENSSAMQYVASYIEKGNAVLVFRNWDGQLCVRMRCGGYRPATRLEAALFRQGRRLLLVRGAEG